METYRFRAMNTDILLAAEGDPALMLQGFEKARKYIEDSERRFTRFSEDSELSALNRSAGSWFHASEEMTFVVSLASQYMEMTHGLFDPTILNDLERIGYDRSMDLIRAEDSLLPVRFDDPGPRPVPSNWLLVNLEKSLIYLPPDVRIDLGGIAKGWIAEQAAAVLAEYATACLVDAGGDIFMIGLPENEHAWQIALEDPRQPDQHLTVLAVPPGAVTTSSVVKRSWIQGETPRHHLIDPRTGEPAVTDWLSVTVIAPHAEMAEVFAKALLIAGPQEADQIAQNAQEISYLAVDREGKIWGSLKSLEYINDQELV